MSRSAKTRSLCTNGSRCYWANPVPAGGLYLESTRASILACCWERRWKVDSFLTSTDWYIIQHPTPEPLQTMWLRMLLPAADERVVLRGAKQTGVVVVDLVGNCR